LKDGSATCVNMLGFISSYVLHLILKDGFEVYVTATQIHWILHMLIKWHLIFFYFRKDKNIVQKSLRRECCRRKHKNCLFISSMKISTSKTAQANLQLLIMIK